MNVTLATVADIPTVLKFSRDLHNHTRYSVFEFDEKKVASLFYNAITGNPKHGVVLLSKDGSKTVGLLGAMAIQPTFTSDWVGSEWVWWVEPTVPNHKKRLIELLDGYEFWAKNVAKCKAILIGRVERFDSAPRYFQKRGYQTAEEAYIKELI